MNVIKIISFLTFLLVAPSCVFKADEVKLVGFDRKGSGARTDEPEEVIEISVESITLENDQLKVTGVHLDSVTSIELESQSLQIISQTANELILSSASAINLALNTAIDLIFY